MKGSVAAELFVLRKRASTRIMLGLWIAMGLMAAYVLPYLTYVNASGTPEQGSLTDLLPASVAGTMIGGFPFFGGVFALILGVLSLGSDYNWGTLKTLFTQRPGRMRVLTSKLVALAITLVPFVLGVFVMGVVSSYAIAQSEGAAVDWPSGWLIVRALVAGWFILAVWAAFGVMLAALWRGTAVAIGVGILYALVVEGLISAFAEQVNVLEPMLDFFLRANGYSLIRPLLGDSVESVAANGPGAFTGPFVDDLQAFLVMSLYLVGFAAVSALLLRRRDVD